MMDEFKIKIESVFIPNMDAEEFIRLYEEKYSRCPVKEMSWVWDCPEDYGVDNDDDIKSFGDQFVFVSKEEDPPFEEETSTLFELAWDAYLG